MKRLGAWCGSTCGVERLFSKLVRVEGSQRADISPKTLLQDAVVTCWHDFLVDTGPSITDDIISQARDLWAGKHQHYSRRPNAHTRLDKGRKRQDKSSDALPSEAAWRRRRKVAVKTAVTAKSQDSRGETQAIPQNMSEASLADAFTDLEEFVARCSKTSVDNMEDSIIQEYAFNQKKMRIAAFEALEAGALTKAEVDKIVQQLGGMDLLAEHLLEFQQARARRAEQKKKEYANQSLKRKMRPPPDLSGLHAFLDVAADLNAALRAHGLHTTQSFQAADLIVTEKTVGELPATWRLAMALRGGTVTEIRKGSSNIVSMCYCVGNDAELRHCCLAQVRLQRFQRRSGVGF